MTQQRIETYEADGVVFRMPVAIEGGAAVTTLAGCALTASARNVLTGASVEGAAVKVSGVEVIEVTFAVGLLARGNWEVRARVIPPASGHPGITLVEPVLVAVI